MAKKLTYEQRCELATLKKLAWPVKDIASSLGVHQCSIYRELGRNTGQKGYRPKQAQELADARAKNSGIAGTIKPETYEIVDSYIIKCWSPEQISGRLKQLGIYISHETIYQHILRDKRAGGKKYTYLRCQKKNKKRYGTGKTDKRGQIKNRVGIEKRPAIVDKKIRKGDWEGDLVIGKNHKGALVTLTERKSKKVLIGYSPTKEADYVSHVICQLLKGETVFTVTFDNGKEFARHEEISDKIGCKVYFAHPYSSWERGLNENTNGLIRQYFPKGASFHSINDRDIKRVENALNNRPRKTLGYNTPNEIYTGSRRITAA